LYDEPWPPRSCGGSFLPKFELGELAQTGKTTIDFGPCIACYNDFSNVSFESELGWLDIFLQQI
jgi:hypothetical protein